MAISLLLFGCGGGAEPKTAADEQGHDAEEDGGSDDDRAPSAGDDATKTSASRSSQQSERRGPDCTDGTCSVCGDGICPTGWYCDESAPGGAACSWLKECAEHPSCACVSKVLGADCKCRDDGGLKVSCG